MRWVSCLVDKCLVFYNLKQNNWLKMYTWCWIEISIPMSTSWVDCINTFKPHCTQCLIFFLNQTRNKNICKLKKATLLRIYFRNLSVQGFCMQYKSQCLKKVNVKYVINRLWLEIFNIVPGISPRPIILYITRRASLSGLIWESRADARPRVDMENVIKTWLPKSAITGTYAWERKN